MTRTREYVLIVACVAVFSASSFGGVPLPDAVLYGSVTIDCRPVSSGADVKVVARVDGVTDPVGTGYFVANALGGDSHVLNIKLESGVDSAPRSAGTARVQDLVHIYVKQGTEPERQVRDYRVSKMGVVEQVNLELHVGQCLGDSDDDGDIDLSDMGVFQKCFTGPGGSAAPGCDVCDANTDVDVDLEDWASVRGLLSGPQ